MDLVEQIFTNTCIERSRREANSQLVEDQHRVIGSMIASNNSLVAEVHRLRSQLIALDTRVALLSDRVDRAIKPADPNDDPDKEESDDDIER